MFEVLTIEPWQNGGGSLSYPGQLKTGEGKWVQNTTDRVTLSNETLIEILGGKFLILFFIFLILNIHMICCLKLINSTRQLRNTVVIIYFQTKNYVLWLCDLLFSLYQIVCIH